MVRLGGPAGAPGAARRRVGLQQALVAAEEAEERLVAAARSAAAASAAVASAADARTSAAHAATARAATVRADINRAAAARAAAAAAAFPFVPALCIVEPEVLEQRDGRCRQPRARGKGDARAARAQRTQSGACLRVEAHHARAAVHNLARGGSPDRRLALVAPVAVEGPQRVVQVEHDERRKRQAEAEGRAGGRAGGGS